MNTRPSYLDRATRGVTFSPREGEHRRLLLQRGVDIAELGAQAATDAVDGGDDRQRNTGCDQPVFNGGRAGFVGEKLLENALHCATRLVVLDWSNNR